jgi:hypothetical protein
MAFKHLFLLYFMVNRAISGSKTVRLQSNAPFRAETENSGLESVPRSLNRDLFVRINAAGLDNNRQDNLKDTSMAAKPA